jgi:hypothetical protein
VEKKSVKTIIAFLLIILAPLASSPAQTPTSSPTTTPPPSTSIQIVNATSVPSISLEVNGRMDYPEFPQGEFTADAPTQGLTYRYKATNKSDGAIVSAKPITYKNLENQTLLLLGDFSKETEEGKIPPIVNPANQEETGKLFPPNLIFRVYSHQEGASESPVRVRIINGMPRKMLRLKANASSSQTDLFPGDEKKLSGQPLVQVYNFEVEGKEFPVLMRQDANPLNANIVFFLRNNEPTYMRFFESTSKPPTD